MTEVLDVPSSIHRTIIGTGGATINGIRAETGANIDIPCVARAQGRPPCDMSHLTRVRSDHPPAPPPPGVPALLGGRVSLHRKDGSDKVTLRGTPEQVALAKEKVLEIVEVQRSVKMESLRVDPSYYGSIIGSKGSSLQRIQEAHNVRVYMPTGGRGGARGGRGRGGSRGSDDIVIRGHADDVEQAKAAILEIVEREVRGPSRQKEDFFGGASAKCGAVAAGLADTVVHAAGPTHGIGPASASGARAATARATRLSSTSRSTTLARRSRTLATPDSRRTARRFTLRPPAVPPRLSGARRPSARLSPFPQGGGARAFLGARQAPRLQLFARVLAPAGDDQSTRACPQVHPTARDKR